MIATWWEASLYSDMKKANVNNLWLQLNIRPSSTWSSHLIFLRRACKARYIDTTRSFFWETNIFIFSFTPNTLRYSFIDNKWYIIYKCQIFAVFACEFIRQAFFNMFISYPSLNHYSWAVLSLWKLSTGLYEMLLPQFNRSQSWRIVVSRGRSWSIMADRGRSWSIVADRGRSWSIVVGR